MTFLSIIIPCYNVEDYLPLTIQSLRSLKDAEDCEFIFINDGSIDGTLDIIQDYANEDKRVIVINQENCGVSAARNSAINIAHGLYILPLDGDDRLLPETISIIKENLKNADLLIAPVQVLKKQTSYISKFPLKTGLYSPYELFKSCTFFPAAPQLVYKFDIINNNHLRFNENIYSGEVLAFTCIFLKFSKTISVTDKYFYQYVMRETSAIHAPNYIKDITVLEIIDFISSNTDSSIRNLHSFNATLFKMCISFTYNKYAKFGFTDDQTIEAIKTVLYHDTFKQCIKKLAFALGFYSSDRFLAIYIYFTGVWGYKLLARFFSKKLC